MTTLEKNLLDHAKLLAPNCERPFRHISFLVQRNKTLAIGFNRYKTHPLAAKFGHRDANIHSELSAIVNLPRSIDISRCTLYNVRVRPDGKSFGLSRPCKHCQRLIMAFNIKNVYYTIDNGTFEKF